MRSHFTNLATIASVLTAISLTAAGPVEVTRDYVNATPQVKTIYEGGEQVTYQGYLNATTNLEQFVGIPFAQPPIGRLRFQRPQPWSPDNVTFFNATTPPPVCAQPGNNVSTENCLQLNVVRHTGVESGEKLPVLVWIYGGNYVSGYSMLEAYNPGQLVQDSIALGQPIVFVSINYRVSAYGGLLGAQAIEVGATNTGILDQRLALQWVKKHIYDFGGDPDKVTIYGQSAGGGSVVGQLVIEGQKPEGLFSGAFVSSGAFGWHYGRDAYLGYQNTLYNLTNCVDSSDPVECMRSVPEADMWTAVNSIGSDMFGSNFGPTFGDDAIPLDPKDLIRQGKVANVPLMVGTTTDEFTGFVTYPLNTSANGANYLGSSFLTLTPKLGSTLWPLYANFSDSEILPSIANASFVPTYPPAFLRTAAASNDILFHANREFLLNAFVNQSRPVYGYSFGQQTDAIASSATQAKFGVTHSGDTPWWFGSTISATRGGQQLGTDMRRALISFVHTGNPSTKDLEWEDYAQSKSSIMSFKSNSTGMTSNTNRRAQLDAALGFLG